MFYRMTVLDNGLTVLSEPMEGVRSVALGIWFAVGSRDESPAEAGMSHFMEHMMFKGTPSRSAYDISDAFDRLGAELNAFTSKEYTAYYSRFVDENLPDAFGLLADMVVNATLADEAAEKERKVVIEEISRMEDTPDDLVHELFARELWPDHPLGLPILGGRETVSTFDHAQSIAFRKRHYVTGNAIVAAAGNVDHDELVELAKSQLLLDEGPRSVRPRADAPAESRIQVLRRETEQVHLVYGTTVFDANHPDRFTLAVLDGTLGGGMASRLFQRVREEHGMAYAVYSYSMLYQDTGEFAVYAGTAPQNVETVVGLIQEEMRSIAENGVTADELDRVRQAVMGQLILGMENTRSRMVRLGRNETTGTEMLSADEIMDRFEAITMDDLKRVAADVLTRDRVLTAIGPFDEGELAHLIEGGSA